MIRQHEVVIRPRGITPFRHQLLRVAAVADNPAVVLHRFFEIYRALGPTAPFLFAVLNTRIIFEENRLLNLMAFGEGYHRTFFDEPPLPPKVHEELRKTMLDSIEARYRGTYSNPLLYANQQSQRQRVGWLIGRAAEVAPGFLTPTTPFATN